MSLLLALTCSPSDYAITLVMDLVKPYHLTVMKDEFQSARLISEKNGIGRFEITIHPLHEQAISGNPNWRIDDRGMTEYLKPRVAANWDAAMRASLLKVLRASGIDPEKLDDKSTVAKVSDWALRRSTFNDQFGLWMVQFKSGQPKIPADLQLSFRNNEPKYKSQKEIFQRELFGKGMFQTKTHGACTSTSTYLATILRAVGIPTRIVVTVPLADGNDPKQIQMVKNALHHHRTAKTILNGIPDGGGNFANHLFNEVWVGKHWVRLNYNRLGQPVLDSNYLGLMVHIDTANDISEIPFAETWGRRFGKGEGPKLSSVNPYRLVSIKETLPADLPNPKVQVLTVQTISRLLKPRDPLPPTLPFPKGADILLLANEWVEGDYHQMRDFLKGSAHTLVLRANGHPNILADITGSVSTGSGTAQGYGFKLRSKPLPGVEYRVTVENKGKSHQWVIPPTLSYLP